jgi:hypothetical protein
LAVAPAPAIWICWAMSVFLSLEYVRREECDRRTRRWEDGWRTGLEPATTGTTTRGSTN